jgi:phage-related protein
MDDEGILFELGAEDTASEAIAALQDSMAALVDQMATVNDTFASLADAMAPLSELSDVAAGLAGTFSDLTASASELAGGMDEVGASGGDAAGGLSEAGSAAHEASGGFGGMIESAKSMVTAFASMWVITKAMEGLKEATVGTIQVAEQHQVVEQQLAAALQSTHDAVGMTAEQLNQLADGFEKTTAYSNDAVLGAENLLLTFTNIGGNVFPQATGAVLDMATAMHQDLRTTAIEVGKALQDPVKGATALQRVGVRLSSSQVELIKQFVATGQAAKAQGVILDELNREFGHSAENYRHTLPGALASLGNSFADIQKQIGGPLLGTLADLVNSVQPLIENLGAALPGAISRAESWFQANLLPVLKQVGAWFMSGGLNALRMYADYVTGVLIPSTVQLVQWFGANILPTLKVLAAFVMGNLVPALMQLDRWMRENVLPVFEQVAAFLVSSVVPAIIQLVRWFEQHVVPVLKVLWTVIATDVLPTLESLVTTVLTKIVPALEHLWNVIAPILIPVLQLLGGLIKNVIGPYLVWWWGIIADGINIIADIIGTIENWIGALGRVKDAVSQFVSHALSFFGHLKDQAGQKITDVKNTIVNTLSDLPQKMLDLAGHIIDGLVNGLKNGLNKIKQTVGNLAGNLLGGLKSAFGIASPSRAMHEIGRHLSEGLVEGLRSVDVAGAAQAHYGGVLGAVGALGAPAASMTGTGLPAGGLGAAGMGGDPVVRALLQQLVAQGSGRVPALGSQVLPATLGAITMSFPGAQFQVSSVESMYQLLTELAGIAQENAGRGATIGLGI